MNPLVWLMQKIAGPNWTPETGSVHTDDELGPSESDLAAINEGRKPPSEEEQEFLLDEWS